mmetsp:Transcript_8559/g.21527  ORF Transcript_8559/g.21527 Transcript_8559/m.21527 type:complete len:81 (-) Transcript_8559:93-335(-)
MWTGSQQNQSWHPGVQHGDLACAVLRGMRHAGATAGNDQTPQVLGGLAVSGSELAAVPRTGPSCWLRVFRLVLVEALPAV